MITLPDLIRLMVYYYKKIMDYPYMFMEAFGSWMSVYGLNKRWRNRKKGTGYVKKPKVY